MQNNILVDWTPLLKLSMWVAQQPCEIPGRTGHVMDKDPDWSWTRRTVGSIVSRGLNTNSISFELRENIWKIIEPLTEDPNPTPAEEHTKDGDFVDDAYTLSINTTRGQAMNTVIEYALWVYRNLEKIKEIGKDKLKKGGLIFMPEVQKVLERHLDPNVDSSIAVRAVYGRFFPWILLIDPPWTIAHLDEILPPGKIDSPLYLAAWQAYIIYVSPYDEPFAVLKNRYLEAILNIGKGKKMRHISEDDRLIEHLMIFYWRGKITLDDELMIRFLDTVDARSRQHALDFIGRSLVSDKTPLSPEIQTRLKELWEQRLKVAQTAKDKVLYAGEMSAFGWWFGSGDFDEKWSCEQYLKALDISEPRSSGDYYIAERLTELVKTLPLETIKILEKLTLKGQYNWLVFGNRDAVKSIILTALQSPEKEANIEAKNLVSRLVANGYIEFRNLLTCEDPPLPQTL